MGKRLTQNEFITKVKEVHGDKYDYSETVYVNSRTKISILCPIHGTFKQSANSHLSGQGCPHCGKISKIKNSTKTTEEIVARFIEVHGNKYDYSKCVYINSDHKVIVTCKKHGDFAIAPYHHLNGSDCKICASSGGKYNTEDFIKKAKDIHGDLYDYSKVDYKGTDIPVVIICKNHGEFIQKPHNHICGCGCQSCPTAKLKSQTLLYDKLKNTFQDEIILCEINNNTVPWLELQRFDIYFPQYNIAVEYNGKQHYEPVKFFGGGEFFKLQQKRDELKRSKCKENSCHLFELRYDYNENDYAELIGKITLIIKNKTNESY